MTTTLSDDILEDLYYKQVKGHPSLKSEWDHYERLDDQEEHPERSYDWLFGCVEKYLSRLHRDKLRKTP